VVLPVKQGLKHTGTMQNDATSIVEVVLPVKQGLKQDYADLQTV